MSNARRRRFVEYFNGPPLKGDRAKLMKRTGLTKGRVSQIFDEGLPFGEIAARNLAEKLGLASDYFEHDRAGTELVLTEEEREIVLTLRLRRANRTGGGAIPNREELLDEAADQHGKRSKGGRK